MKTMMTDKLKQEKQFALMMSWAVPLFFFVLLPWFFSFNRHAWPIVVSGLFLVLYFILPQWISYPYRLWMFISVIMGWVNTRIILGLTYYVMILPMGLVLKMLGKLHYQPDIDKQRQSYYILTETKKIDKDDLERPF